MGNLASAAVMEVGIAGQPTEHDAWEGQIGDAQVALSRTATDKSLTATESVCKPGDMTERC